MSEVLLPAVRRELTGKKVSQLRREGKLPAILYGHSINPTPITLDAKEATSILANLSSSSLVTIDLEGEKHSALVRDKARNFIRGNLLHVDFQVVSLNEKVKANVTIEQIGVSPAIKEYSGVVVTELFAVEVESLPADLPEKFVIDLSSLKEIGDAIYVKDLIIPENVQVLHNQEDLVVQVSAGAIEPEPEIGEEEEAELQEPEVIARERSEEEAEE
jgi:large subunit ribosomal protein L25